MFPPPSKVDRRAPHSGLRTGQGLARGQCQRIGVACNRAEGAGAHLGGTHGGEHALAPRLGTATAANGPARAVHDAALSAMRHAKLKLKRATCRHASGDGQKHTQQFYLQRPRGCLCTACSSKDEHLTQSLISAGQWEAHAARTSPPPPPNPTPCTPNRTHCTER